MKKILEELDKLYLKDESSLVYEGYEIFKKLVKPQMSKKDYVIKFEQLYQKVKF